MQHTYLRYECADAFGLVSSSASSKAPQSNSILAFGSSTKSRPIVLTTAGSFCIGYHLRTTDPVIKIGHRENLSGGVGTRKALNSDQIVCLEAATSQHDNTCKVATGWTDGGVRVFDIQSDEISTDTALIQTLVNESQDEDFIMREPLVLNGHSGSPIRSVKFDSNNASRLASGSSDGSVVLWDIVAESGLFRLLGHRGGITDISFLSLQDNALDLLVTSSLDGFVKIFDLKGQCCIQTIPTLKGEVWGSACIKIPSSVNSAATEIDDNVRTRLVTGSSDGLTRVWSVEALHRNSKDPDSMEVDAMGADERSGAGANAGEVCQYMGTLPAPPNVAISAERIACIHFHPNGKFIGVLHANSKVVDVYAIRSLEESIRKKQRRLRRRKEKAAKGEKTGHSSDTTAGTKRGMLDDPDPETELETDVGTLPLENSLDPEALKATDEFEYYGSVRASHKVKGFVFVPYKEKGAGLRIVCSLTTNSMEFHTLRKTDEREGGKSIIVANKLSSMDMLGHPTGIRAIELSHDDSLACTVSKNSTKIWNVARRSCILSLSPSVNNIACYGLCVVFLPGNSHTILGTREGHLLILDVASGDIVFTEENAHDGAIWSIDVRRPSVEQPIINIVTGSGDKTIKFWEIEAQEDNDSPMLTHTRTLEMSDDVVAVRYSHSTDPTKRMVFVSSLDSTIKVFFDDTLKFFLSLYGHKLPALALDASDDDAILASAGADKTIKIWGLDFGDTHRTLHGHEDSITDLRFVKRTHNFFTTSKDMTVRYWDGDRFEQILILNGHFAEVSSLAISRTGAFVLSGGMDRQIRVWERTKDIVFLEEERERELEDMFDRVEGQAGETTSRILQKNADEDEDGGEMGQDEEPQSEAAVKKSVLSVSAGDRILESLERADQELKDAATFRKANPGKEKMPNPFLLGMEPPLYILWVLKSIRHAELEQSLLVLPFTHVERLFYYLTVLLKSGRGVEICSRVGIFLIKTQQNQIIANPSLAAPLRELRRLMRLHLASSRDVVGYNLAALRSVAKAASDKKESFLDFSNQNDEDIWAGMGLSSDLAAAVEGRKRS